MTRAFLALEGISSVFLLQNFLFCSLCAKKEGEIGKYKGPWELNKRQLCPRWEKISLPFKVFLHLTKIEPKTFCKHFMLYILQHGLLGLIELTFYLLLRLADLSFTLEVLSVEYIHKDNGISSVLKMHTQTHERWTGSHLPQSYSGVVRSLEHWHETFGEDHRKACAVPQPFKHIQQLSGL